MATINTSPALKLALQKLKAEMKFASTREQVVTAVKMALGIDESHQQFEELVDKLCVKQGIKTQVSSYATEFVNVLQVINLFTQLGKIRCVSKLNVAEQSNKLADALFAQYKRAGNKLSMAAVKKVFSQYQFVLGPQVKTVKVFTDACAKDAQKVSVIKQQVVMDRVATQKVLQNKLEGQVLVDRINDIFGEFNGHASSFPTPEADKVGNPNNRMNEFTDENDFIDAVTDYKYAWEEDLAHYLGFESAKEMLDATGIEDADWKLFQSFSDNFAWYADNVKVQQVTKKPVKKINTLQQFAEFFGNNVEMMQNLKNYELFVAVTKGAVNWDDITTVFATLGITAGKSFKFKSTHTVDGMKFVGIKVKADGLYGFDAKGNLSHVTSVPNAQKLLRFVAAELKYNKKFEKTLNNYRDTVKLVIDNYNNGTLDPNTTADTQVQTVQVVQQKAQQAVQQMVDDATAGDDVTEDDVKELKDMINAVNHIMKTNIYDTDATWYDIYVYLKNINPDKSYGLYNNGSSNIGIWDGDDLVYEWVKYDSANDSLMVEDKNGNWYDIDTDGNPNCLLAVAQRIKKTPLFNQTCNELAKIVNQ